MSKKKGSNLEQSVSGAVPATPEMNDYETQGHLDTLIKAHGIMNDPTKMGKVHALAGRQHKALKGIKKVSVTSTDDLRKLANKKFGPKSGNDLEDLKDGGSDELEEGGE